MYKRQVEHGRHSQLLAEEGLYAELYHTQFADQADEAEELEEIEELSAVEDRS